MAVTKAKRGYGGNIRIGDGASPEGFTKVIEVKRISGVGVNKPLSDATHLESPGDTKEYIAGMADGKTPTFTVNWTVDNEVILMNLINMTTNVNIRVYYPGALKAYQFPGTPIDLEIGEMTADGVIEATFQLKIAGAITTL